MGAAALTLHGGRVGRAPGVEREFWRLKSGPDARPKRGEFGAGSTDPVIFSPTFRPGFLHKAPSIKDELLRAMVNVAARRFELVYRIRLH